jgi:hypothetical protein
VTANHKFLAPGTVIVLRNDNATHWVIIQELKSCEGKACASYLALITTESHNGISNKMYDDFNGIEVPYQWTGAIEIDLRGGKWKSFLPIITPYVTIL